MVLECLRLFFQGQSSLSFISWQFLFSRVRSKDAQKQLAETFSKVGTH